jgi:hypothetical protein
MLRGLRNVCIEYLFGDKYIKTRANKIVLAAHFLYFPQSSFEFTRLNEALDESSISEEEKSDLREKFSQKSEEWIEDARNFITKIDASVNKTTETPSLNLSQLPPKLRNLSTSNDIYSDLRNYESFNGVEFVKCE